MATTTKTPERPCGHGQPLDEVRAALTGLGKDLRTGGRDLFGDLETLVRSARRDTSKLGNALGTDLERLAKAAPRLQPPPPPTPRRAAPRPRRPAGSHPKKKTAA